MAGWLTDSEITAMRTVVSSGVMPDTCVIKGKTETSDGAGGVSYTYASVTGGTVACRLDPILRRGQIEVIGGQEGVTFDFVFTLPTTAPITIDRIITHSGHDYEIRQISDDPSWLLCRRAYVARVDT